MLFLRGRSSQYLEMIKDENGQMVAGSSYTVYLDRPVVTPPNVSCESVKISNYATSLNPDCHKPAIDEM